MITIDIPPGNETAVGGAIAKTYRAAFEQPLPEFKSQALEQLALLTQCDGASWLTFTGPDNRLNPELTASIGLPPAFVTGYNELFRQTSLATLCRQHRLQNDYSVIVPLNSSNSGGTGHTRYLQNFAIDQQLLTLTGGYHISHLIAIYRRANSTPFNHDDVILNAFFLPNLGNAFQLALQQQLKSDWAHPVSHKAICDAQGHIIEAEAGFDECLNNNLTDWDGKCLPDPPHSGKQKHSYRQIRITTHLIEGHDLYLAEAYHFDPNIESLTAAERSIAAELLGGKRNQQIAETLGRKIKTIENQLRSLCQKLEADNRTEALWLLQQSNYRF